MDIHLKTGAHISKSISNNYTHCQDQELSVHTIKISMQALVLGKYYYYNSLLAVSMDYHITKLLRIQNMTCRVI